MTEWLDVLDREYLADYIAAGGGCVKFAVGGRETALPVLEGIEAVAVRRGFAFIELGAAQTRLNRSDDIFFEIARTIDPRVRIATLERVRVHALRGEWDLVDERISLVRDDGDSSPFIYWGNLVRYQMWRRDRTTAAAVVAAVRAGPRATQRLVSGLTDALDEAAPRRSFDEIFPARTNTLRRAAFISQLRAELAGFWNERDELLESVEAATAAGLIDLAWMDHCPLLGAARSEPRFLAARAHVAGRTAGILAELLPGLSGLVG